MCSPGRALFRVPLHIFFRKELVQYLPPHEVPAQTTKKKRSLGPSNSMVMDTPSPILYKRSRNRLDDDDVEEELGVKKQKLNSDVNEWISFPYKKYVEMTIPPYHIACRQWD